MGHAPAEHLRARDFVNSALLVASQLEASVIIKKSFQC